jgi:hypothetical protein
MSTTLRDDREIIREEPIMRERIVELLSDGPKTVPELASALERPTHEVLFWVMGMRRYGRLHEVGAADADGYFRYEAITRDSA